MKDDHSSTKIGRITASKKITQEMPSVRYFHPPIVLITSKVTAYAPARPKSDGNWWMARKILVVKTEIFAGTPISAGTSKASMPRTKLIKSTLNIAGRISGKVTRKKV